MIGVLFIESSLSFLLLGLKMDGVTIVPYMLVDLFPAFVGIYTLLRFRRWLGYVWDVSMRIRPLEFDFYEPSFLGKLIKNISSSKVAPEDEEEESDEESEEDEGEGEEDENMANDKEDDGEEKV